jgi:DNA-3-methyladenine glycosylase
MNYFYDRITDPLFFNINAVKLAKKLLGKILVINFSQNQPPIKVRIIETEAYIGKIDRACHAHPSHRSQ